MSALRRIASCNTQLKCRYTLCKDGYIRDEEVEATRQDFENIFGNRFKEIEEEDAIRSRR